VCAESYEGLASSAFASLCRTIGDAGARHRLLVVPGGARPADATSRPSPAPARPDLPKPGEEAMRPEPPRGRLPGAGRGAL